VWQSCAAILRADQAFDVPWRLIDHLPKCLETVLCGSNIDRSRTFVQNQADTMSLSSVSSWLLRASLPGSSEEVVRTHFFDGTSGTLHWSLLRTLAYLSLQVCKDPIQAWKYPFGSTDLLSSSQAGPASDKSLILQLSTCTSQARNENMPKHTHQAMTDDSFCSSDAAQKLMFSTSCCIHDYARHHTYQTSTCHMSLILCINRLK